MNIKKTIFIVLIIVLIFVLFAAVVGNTKWHSASTGSYAYAYALKNAYQLSRIDRDGVNFYYGEVSDCEPFSVSQECAPIRVSDSALEDENHFQLILNTIRNPCEFMFIGNKEEFKQNSTAEQASRYLRCGSEKGKHIKVVLVFIDKYGMQRFKFVIYPTRSE